MMLSLEFMDNGLYLIVGILILNIENAGYNEFDNWIYSYKHLSHNWKNKRCFSLKSDQIKNKNSMESICYQNINARHL